MQRAEDECGKRREHQALVRDKFAVYFNRNIYPNRIATFLLTYTEVILLMCYLVCVGINSVLTI